MVASRFQRVMKSKFKGASTIARVNPKQPQQVLLVDLPFANWVVLPLLTLFLCSVLAVGYLKTLEPDAVFLLSALGGLLGFLVGVSLTKFK